MTEQKLRKFKLIDREGYLESDESNKRFLDEFFSGDTVTGFFNEVGDLKNELGDYLINACEFKFFEEVFEEEQQDWDGEGTPPVGTICECNYPNNGWHKIKYMGKGMDNLHVVSYENGDTLNLGSLLEFRPLQPKSWQEKLCEEFADFDTELGTISYHGSMAKEDLILFAKRVIELSGEGNE